MGGRKGQIIAESTAGGAAPEVEARLSPGVRRCRLCGIRKVLDRGFYRDRRSSGGYRRECKRCRNRARARWARGRYVPKTGRRYLTKGDRAEAAARGPEASR